MDPWHCVTGCNSVGESVSLQHSPFENKDVQFDLNFNGSEMWIWDAEEVPRKRIIYSALLRPNRRVQIVASKFTMWNSYSATKKKPHSDTRNPKQPPKWYSQCTIRQASHLINLPRDKIRETNNSLAEERETPPSSIAVTLCIPTCTVILCWELRFSQRGEKE